MGVRIGPVVVGVGVNLVQLRRLRPAWGCEFGVEKLGGDEGGSWLCGGPWLFMRMFIQSSFNGFDWTGSDVAASQGGFGFSDDDRVGRR